MNQFKHKRLGTGLTTLLRKNADPKRENFVSAPNNLIKNEEVITKVRSGPAGSGFSWIRTSKGKEGYVRDKYLTPCTTAATNSTSPPTLDIYVSLAVKPADAILMATKTDDEKMTKEWATKCDAPDTQFRWESKVIGGSWVGCSAWLDRKLENAKKAGKPSLTFTYSKKHTGAFRSGDSNTLSYTVTFKTMKQVCDQHKDRIRNIRRVNRDCELTPCQYKAILFAEFQGGKGDALQKGRGYYLDKTLKDLGGKRQDLYNLERWIKNDCKMIIHIEFDKELRIGCMLIDALLKSEHYKNLFETKQGNGSESVDNRTKWENKTFSDAYKDAEPIDRPKYGTINVTDHPKGVKAAKLYGKSYMIVKNSVRWRTSLTNRDSCGYNPDTDYNATFRLNTFEFIQNIIKEDGMPLKRIADHNGGANPNKYPEVQYHGMLMFNRDFEKICADKKLSAAVQMKVNQFGAKYKIPVEFIDAFP